MSTINIKLMLTILLSSSLFICASADAYDASVSNFNWISPQTLIPQTSEIKYSYRFQLTPHSLPYDCSYDVQLYLSRDTVLSSDDFALFSSSDVDLPAGAVSFSAETTRFFYSDISLPSSGTYYVFIKITPGSGAPMDTNSSNNSDMDPSLIQVGTPPPPPPPGPKKPINPNPSNEATGQSLDVLLRWDNGGGATSYDVYFGTDSTPDSTEFMGNQASISYSPDIVSYGTTYYWRIDAKNANGTARGDVWSFSTIQDVSPTFIPIPGRKDHVFDPVNQILYTTTDSGAVERYDTTGNFLGFWTIGGNLGGIDVTPNGDKVLIADQSYDTNVGYFHSVDASSGIVTTIEFPLCEGHQFDGGVLSFDPFNSKIYVSYKDGIGIHPINIPFNATEDFETGDFSKFPWEHSGDANWTIASQESSSGLYSARAGSITNNGVTTLEVTLECNSGDIAFYRKVSSEPNWDRLKFYIDGVKIGDWSGELDWEEVSFPVTAGSRTFTWTYSKDSSVSRGDDTAWIDDIVFPIASGASVGVNVEMHSNQFNSMEVSEQSSIHTEFIEIIED